MWAATRQLSQQYMGKNREIVTIRRHNQAIHTIINCKWRELDTGQAKKGVCVCVQACLYIHIPTYTHTCFPCPGITCPSVIRSIYCTLELYQIEPTTGNTVPQTVNWQAIFHLYSDLFQSGTKKFARLLWALHFSQEQHFAEGNLSLLTSSVCSALDKSAFTGNMP